MASAAAAGSAPRGSDAPPRCSRRPRRRAARGRGRPRLIAARGAGRADARRDDQEVRAAGLAHEGDLLRRGHDAVRARVLGEHGQTAHGVRDGRRSPRCSPSVCSSWLVRMVMARRRMPIAGRAPTAASIISLPPERVDVDAARRRAGRRSLTAPATVFGMSWNLRSRKTFSPARDQLAHEVGPGGGEELAADLEHADVAGAGGRRSARAVVGVGHVEGDDEPVARASSRQLLRARAGPDSSSVPTTRLMSSRPCRSR